MKLAAVSGIALGMSRLTPAQAATFSEHDALAARGIRRPATGRIDGFCAGAPWGAVAAHVGVGRPLLPSSAIWSNHPEKCLAVLDAWAGANPAALEGMMTALVEAARFCGAPGNAGEVADILAQDRYLAIDADAIRDVLPTFFAGAANFPWKSHAHWFLNEMTRWGLLPLEADRLSASELYRPDLFRAVAAKAGISVPVHDAKVEGAHSVPWALEGVPESIPMGPDSFCDRRQF